MEKIRGDQIILKGQPASPAEYTPDPSEGILYEVIRQIDGHLLFAEDHLDRLHASCSASGMSCPDKQLLYHNLEQLRDAVPFRNGNIKLVVFRRLGDPHIACFFIPHFYPSEEDYQKGVHTKSYAYERPDPNIKRWNEDFRHNVRKFIRDEYVYEAILMNQEGKLTEGSRSNLFFINDNLQVITAPQNMILPGVTRKHVLNICRNQRFNVIEKVLDLEEAGQMVSCFISGTSPKVLPVRKLDEIRFSPDNEVTRTIIASFDRLIG